MKNRRHTPTQPARASRLLSTFESAGLAATATFASVLWIGLALPGLPLLPGVGGGQNSNVAISLNSAVLGVQDSRTFGHSTGTAGRQARLLSLLLPAPDPLGKDLATKRPDSEASSNGSMVVALPSPPPAQAAPRDDGPRVIESTHLASASGPAPAPPAPPCPARLRLPPRRPRGSRIRSPSRLQLPRSRLIRLRPRIPMARRWPAIPRPATEARRTRLRRLTQAPVPRTETATGNGNGNGNAGGNNPNAGGNNPNAGGANAGGNGNGNGNGNAGGNNPNAGGNNPNAGGANAGGNGNGAAATTRTRAATTPTPAAPTQAATATATATGGNNPNAGGNNPNAGGANAGGNGNGNAGGNNPNAGGNNPNAGGANAGGNGNGNGNAGGNNPNAGGNNPNAGGANAGGNGNGNGAPQGLRTRDIRWKAAFVLAMAGWPSPGLRSSSS